MMEEKIEMSKKKQTYLLSSSLQHLTIVDGARFDGINEINDRMTGAD